MKKRFILALSLLLIAALALCTLSGCNNKTLWDVIADGQAKANEKPVYTVSFDSDGAGEFASQSVEEGSHAAHPGTPEKAGYIFIGWYLNGSVFVFSENKISADIKLVAGWAAAEDNCSVSFNSAGGTLTPAQVVSRGGKATAPTAPTKAGYSFDGWYLDGSAYSFDTAVSANITLVAKWTPVVYTIEYELGEGIATELPTTYTVESDDITIAAPTKEDHTFCGWTYDGVTEPVLSLTISRGSVGNLKLVANWELTKYNLTYDVADGQNPDNPKFYTSADADITLAAPTRLGYKFVGWTSDSITVPTMNVTVASGSEGDLHFVANWEFVYYNVKYELNGGTNAYITTNKNSVNIEELPITLAPSTQENMYFIGWYLDAELSKPITQLSTDLIKRCTCVDDGCSSEGCVHGCLDITVYAGFISTTDGLIYTLNESGTGYLVSGYTGSARAVYIASSYEGLPVVGIADGAFKALKITSVTMPDTVVSIGKDAFKNCTSLTKATLSENLATIGAGAFDGCKSLANNATKYAQCAYIGSESNLYMVLLSANATTILDVTLHPDTVHIAPCAFEGCTKLTSITLHTGIKTIGAYAFSGCTGLTHVLISDGTLEIGASAFQDCTALVNIRIPSTLTFIGNLALQGCNSLAYTEDESRVRYLGNESNAYLLVKETLNKSITEYEFKSGAKLIYGYAFSDCEKLATVSGTEDVIFVGNHAFLSTAVAEGELQFADGYVVDGVIK